MNAQAETDAAMNERRRTMFESFMNCIAGEHWVYAISCVNLVETGCFIVLGKGKMTKTKTIYDLSLEVNLNL